MKQIIYILSGIAVIIALVFTVLAYQQQQSVVQTQETQSAPSVTESEADIAKRILLGQLETNHLPEADRVRAETSARQQIDDDTRLYEMAVAAGTVVSSSSRFFAWQRELYNHTDEAGLAAYIASLGITEDAYRQLIERRLMVTTFVESKAAARVTAEDIRAYYDSLENPERDTFEMMEPEIRDNLIAAQIPLVRQELLAQ
jgi:hypothetical protein